MTLSTPSSYEEMSIIHRLNYDGPLQGSTANQMTASSVLLRILHSPTHALLEKGERGGEGKERSQDAFEQLVKNGVGT